MDNNDYKGGGTSNTNDTKCNIVKLKIKEVIKNKKAIEKFTLAHSENTRRNAHFHVHSQNA